MITQCSWCDANQRYISDEAKQQGWTGSKYCVPCLRKMFPEAPLMDGEQEAPQ